jgi:hypothetical protein
MGFWRINIRDSDFIFISVERVAIDDTLAPAVIATQLKFNCAVFV